MKLDSATVCGIVHVNLRVPPEAVKEDWSLSSFLARPMSEILMLQHFDVRCNKT
jgi:hypothetical protein